MTKVDLTRNEIVELLKEFPESHWMTPRLVDALVESTNRSNESFLKNSAVLIKPKSKNNDEHMLSNSEKQKTNLDVIADNAEKSNKIDKNHCAWELYGHYCNKKVNDDSIQLCPEHIVKKCEKCGRQAVHGCPEELQFVCGEPLCEYCHHRSTGKSLY